MEIFARNLIDPIVLWLPVIGMALLVFLFFWALSRIAYKAIMKFSGKFRLATPVALILARLTKIGLLIIGAITSLGTLGIDVSALVAGLGLTGFALGFAMKDTISNFLAGVLLLIYRPFEAQDRIRISGHEGRVISIDLRYTTLQREDCKVYIPNSHIFTNPVILLNDDLSSTDHNQ